MKMCERCGERPVANIHGRYCLECREIAKKEARQRGKEAHRQYDANRRQNLKAQKRREEVNKRSGQCDVPKERSGCPGCIYYRLFYAGEYACHYTINTDKLRPMPAKDCYRHEGTPYTPETSSEE